MYLIYLNFMLKAGRGVINGVEGKYYLDNEVERVRIEVVARHYGVDFLTAGSDYQPVKMVPKMYSSKGVSFYQQPGVHPDGLPLIMSKSNLEALSEFKPNQQILSNEAQR